MRETRYLDQLVDELAKGRALACSNRYPPGIGKCVVTSVTHATMRICRFR